MRRASFQKTFLSQTACELSYPLLSLFSGEILSLLSTPPGAGEHTGAGRTPGAVGLRSAAPGEQVGVSGVLLQGISPMDEDVQPNYSPPVDIFFLPTGGDSKRPPSGYRSHSLRRLHRFIEPEATQHLNDIQMRMET